MFKNLFKHKNKDSPFDSPKNYTESTPPARLPGSGTHEEARTKPFHIDFNHIGNYDTPELQSFIQKYEQYTTFLRENHNEILAELNLEREKFHLLEQERKRLVEENFQFKTELAKVKQLLEENHHHHTGSPSEKFAKFRGTMTGGNTEWENLIEELKQKVGKIEGGLETMKDKCEEEFQQLLLKLKTPVAALEKEAHTEVQREETHPTEDTDSEKKSPLEKSPNGIEEQTGEEESKKGPELMESQVEQEHEEDDGRQVEEMEMKKEKEKDQEKDQEKDKEELEKLSVSTVETGVLELKELLKELPKIIEEIRLAGVSHIENTKGLEEVNKELEKEKKEIEERLLGEQEEMNKIKGELEEKVKELEAANQEKEEMNLKLQIVMREIEGLDQTQSETVGELQKKIDELKESAQKMETEKEELEKKKEDLEGQLAENQKQLGEREAAEKELREKVEEIGQAMKTLEESRKDVEAKLAEAQLEKTDIENSLIQERLKHHQTSGDLNRANEKLEASEKSLNEEIEARKADVWKMEEYKRHIVEVEHKMKEYKHTAKKLTEQMKELEKQAPPQLKRGKSNISETHETVTVPAEFLDKDNLINTQLVKIQQLEEKLEENQKEVTAKEERNKGLSEENERLRYQNKVLQEKRENGLQEMRRLSMILEQCKNGQIDFSNQSLKPIHVLNSKIDGEFGERRKEREFDALMNIKKGLDDVYKTIIITITNEQTQETKGGKKPTGKLGELVKGSLPPEMFMKIEKKMNDTIVLFQEYLENFE